MALTNKILVLIFFFIFSCNSEDSVSSRKKVCKTVKVNVESCKVYSNNSLFSEGLYFKGQPTGFHKYYRNSSLKEEREYILIETESKPDSVISEINQVIKYNDFGDTIHEECELLKILPISGKQYNIGDSIKVEINVFSKSFEQGKSSIEIQMDHPNDSSLMFIKYSEKPFKSFYINPSNVGEYDLRGVVYVGEKGENKIIDKKFYFQLNFLVQ